LGCRAKNEIVSSMDGRDNFFQENRKNEGECELICMKDEVIQKLQFIKDKITEGTYQILSKTQWDEFAHDLSSIGADILKEIEQKRDKARNITVQFLFFRVREKLKELEDEYNEIAKNYDRFFDASMRWLKSIIDGNKYEEYQTLMKKYIEGLIEHCRQASDYLGNLVSSMRNKYHHFQILFISLIAIVIATVSLTISSLK